jgi:hypothetical protein
MQFHSIARQRHDAFLREAENERIAAELRLSIAKPSPTPQRRLVMPHLSLTLQRQAH